MGMDSMTAVEIKETLEREFELYLTPREIRKLTFAILDELSAANLCTEVDKRELEGTNTLFLIRWGIDYTGNKGIGFALLSLSYHEDMREWRYNTTNS
jgi:hypothetical protein